MSISDKITKLKRTPGSVLIRKLLSFDNVYVTAVRPYDPAHSLTHINENGSFTGDEFIPVCIDRRYWYADPSLFTYDGRTWLFTEAFDKHELIGRIACTELPSPVSDEGHDSMQRPERMDALLSEIRPPVIVLSEDFHLSFPQVFTWKEGIYMIPETSTDNSVRLYRASDFPYKWELTARFPMNIQLVDTVITSADEDGITILTSEVGHDREYDYRYHRYHISGGDTLTITEDPSFRVNTDFDRRSRNAGGVFDESGSKILPTQFSTDAVYGAGMEFIAYSGEYGAHDLFGTSHGKVSPGDLSIRGFKGCRHGGTPAIGTHTYSRNDAYEVIDLMYQEFTPMKYIRRLIRRGGAI